VLSKEGNPKDDCFETKASFSYVISLYDRSQWLRGLRLTSAAARLLGLGGSNPTGSMDVCLSVVSVVCCQVEVSMTS
jgi:hypothetical protein